MLQYEEAKKYYEEMKEKTLKTSIGEFNSFYKLFLKSAVEYANTRASWACMDSAARIEDDYSRRVKHDAFSSLLNAISRNLGLEGIDEIMSERKAKGDFACYIALFLALEQR